MEQYNVTGMSCAACQTRVEKAVSKVPGVTSCAVSLLTNSMGVEGTASPAEIIAAVENAGYGASKKGEKGSTSQSASTAEYEEMLKDKETPVMKRRLVSSVLLLIPLMYFSMGHMMWGWPLPKFFEGNHIAMGLVQLLLTIAVMVINSSGIDGAGAEVAAALQRKGFIISGVETGKTSSNPTTTITTSTRNTDVFYGMPFACVIRDGGSSNQAVVNIGRDYHKKGK